MQRWERLCYARTEQEFEQLYATFHADYYHIHSLWEYINTEKYPKRKEFAKPWTGQVNHFGHTVTSAGEAGHSTFKKFLLHSKHDLLEIKDCWLLMTRTFLTNYRKQLAQERDRTTYELRVTRWNPKEVDPITKRPIHYLDPELNSQICDRALKLLVKQLKFASDEIEYNKPCTGYFEQIYSIPCYHTIRELRAANIMIKKGHFHGYWHIERDNESLPLPPAPPAPLGPILCT